MQILSYYDLAKNVSVSRSLNIQCMDFLFSCKYQLRLVKYIIVTGAFDVSLFLMHVDICKVFFWNKSILAPFQ